MNSQRLLILALTLIAALAMTAASAPAQPVPEGLQDVGVDEHPDAQLPLNAVFTDEMGQQVRLGDLIIPGKPAILQLSYFGCPMLCDLVSKGMLASVEDLDLEMGTDYSVINISFDLRETRNDAFLKKKGYMSQLNRPGAAAGWHFLVGDKQSIAKVTDAVGFRYKWMTDQQQFSHPAVLMIITPQGHISRYLYGVSFPNRTLRLSLVEAAQGKIGTTVDKILMVCMHYDPSSGTYKLAMGTMRLGGGLTAVMLGSWIFWLVRRGHHKTREMKSAA